MVSKEKERYPKKVGGGGRGTYMCTCKSGEGGKKIEARGRGGWKGRVGVGRVLQNEWWKDERVGGS